MHKVRLAAAVVAALTSGALAGVAAPASQPMTTSIAASRPANRLAGSTSPYLLQHAHNPVDWHPWGTEALEKARREDKPIFLSIGYAACHWCHVMERESFENDQIAEVLNTHFVSIKVDREERPDLDEVYMNATLLYNQGQGGWPMSVFLAPDGRPFFAGTYFPPESRWGRPGFKELLLEVAQLWREDRERIVKGAQGLTEAVAKFSQPTAGEGIPAGLVSRVTADLAKLFDEEHGGMSSGGSNKFPPSMAMSLMLRQHHRVRQTGNPSDDLLDPVELTLRKMARGGIYDHLGGGIARYSTDPKWLVPHFEKMLYDQALVSAIYLEAFQATANTEYADVARDIFRYVLADLRSKEGGFYSTRDADSEGVEGKYYVWSKAEVMSVLGEPAGDWFCNAYDVSEPGNWEGHNILNRPRELHVVARQQGINLEQLQQSLGESRAKLLEVRAKRVPPGLDDKILTAWNGLMIASLARAGRVLGEEQYTQAAAGAADFVLDQMSRDGRLLRTYRAGRAHTGGYLDDYAFFIDGLIELHQTTLDWRWLDHAERLTDQMIELFWDQRDGAFFFTASDAEALFVRAKDTRDGATPAGNSVAVMDLLRLAAILGREDLADKARATFAALAGNVEQNGGMSFDRLLTAVDFAAHSPREVVIIGSPADPDTRALIAAAHQGYDPDRVLLLADPASPGTAARQERIGLLKGRGLVEGRPAAYVCRNQTCRRPVTSPDDLRQELEG